MSWFLLFLGLFPIWPGHYSPQNNTPAPPPTRAPALQTAPGFRDPQQFVGPVAPGQHTARSGNGRPINP